MQTGSTGYVARIRWRSKIDPDWEIDTSHRTFESWKEAACFANGLGAPGASELVLSEGAFVLRLVNGRCIPVADENLVVWHREMPTGAAVGSEDSAFVAAAEGAKKLSRNGLDGEFKAVLFGIDAIGSSQRIDVTVEADAARLAVRIRVVVAREPEEGDLEFLERLARPGTA
jgi:hypothetical protein